MQSEFVSMNLQRIENENSVRINNDGDDGVKSNKDISLR